MSFEIQILAGILDMFLFCFVSSRHGSSVTLAVLEIAL